MATLTVQATTAAGVTPAAAVSAAGGGDQFANNGKTMLEIVNGGVGSITATIASQNPCSQGATHNTTITIPAGETRRAGPFDPARYNDGSGNVQVTYSGVTSVTVRAYSE
jgi:hypothetical protein